MLKKNEESSEAYVMNTLTIWCLEKFENPSWKCHPTELIFD